MLGSPPRTPAVSASKRLAQRLHINGNAIYHVGSTAFMAFLDGVEKNKADNSAWQVRGGVRLRIAAALVRPRTQPLPRLGRAPPA